jgi:hypothetical protein
MMLLSRPNTVGEAAEYNSACVNTLRRSLSGNYSPVTREDISGDLFIYWGRK